MLLPALLGATLTAATLVAPRTAADDTLRVGHPAPALSIEHFVQGDAVSSLEPGTVYVIEFWATWCKPCIAAFPHLSDTQEKYADDVVVIGVSDEKLDKVTKFLAKPGMTERARYRMATDPDTSMHKDWMSAAKQMGIPCTFIVDREGVIRYIGHPMAMDSALARVVGGEDATTADEPERGPPMLPPYHSRHSDEAKAWIARFEHNLGKGDRLERFKQMLAFEGMVMGGESMRIEAHRDGTVTRAAGLGARIDSVKSMQMPGMGDMPMEEEELVIATADAFQLETGSFMGPGRTRIARSEATELSDAMPMPATGRMVLDSNPILADPLAGILALLEQSSLEVRSEEDGVIVLGGTGNPLLAMPSGMDFDPTDTPVHVELDGAAALPTKVVVGDPADPVFSLAVSYEDLAERPADDLFAIDTELPDLGPILRQQMEMMKAMAPPSDDLPDEF